MAGRARHIRRVIEIVLLAGLVALALYVRLAPVDPAQWHRLPQDMRAGERPGGAVRVIEGDAEELVRLHHLILATPRTHVLAGGPEQGMVTYETRSLVFGFPDYTTVAQRDGRIVIWGRLRFGRSDLGVNARRIDRWLERLGQGR